MFDRTLWVARWACACLLASGSLVALGAPAPAEALAPRYAFGTIVDYPLAFPVAGDPYYADDQYLGFWACRDGCESIHHAIDLMADKMTEVYAVADATVSWVGSTCCSLGLDHDDGWGSYYIHLNNDTPGTNDGQGWGIAPGLAVGSHVRRGQLIGWVGDSGNAEETAPHLHFELHAPGGIEVDPFNSLEEAEAARGFTCEGEPATRVDTNGDRRIIGTPFDDVIVGTPGDDYIDGAGGNDLICGGDGADVLRGGPGDDELDGGPGPDDLSGGEGRDRLLGGPGPDRLRWDPGRDTLNGGGGRDIADYRDAPVAVAVDLAAGTAAADAVDVVVLVEVVYGTAFDDLIRGTPRADFLSGLGGDDRIEGGGGHDVLSGGPGSDSLDGGSGDDTIRGGWGRDEAFGGPGTDVCVAESTHDCEA
jgi:Ca2+-binding RTX toxin-like protein